jgi:hypothetical protein
MFPKLLNTVVFYSLKLEPLIMLVRKFGKTSLMITRVTFGPWVA